MVSDLCLQIEGTRQIIVDGKKVILISGTIRPISSDNSIESKFISATTSDECSNHTSNNIKPFCGKPIIAYAINTAIESKIFDRISTDSEEIKSIAMSFGVEVLALRQSDLSDDFATRCDEL